jgi:PAN domain
MTSIRYLLCVMTAALLASALSPAHATLTVVPRGSQMDTNFPGQDIRSFRSEDAMDCSQACSRTRGCMAWTWVRPGVQGPSGMCWLKSGAPTVVRDRCCMSGLRESTGQREANVDRPGMDYKSFDLPKSTASLCEQACTDDRACRAWTYVVPGVQGPSARCWLKKGVPNPVANNCCTSGVLR